MRKIYFGFFLLLFCFSIAGAIYWFTLQEKGRLAHFYLGAEGGNAQVSLNQQVLGAAPIKDHTLPGGWYELNLSTDYYTYTTPLRLTPQTATVVDWTVAQTLEQSSGLIYELLPADDAPHLEIVTIPDRASLTLDDTPPAYFSPYQYATVPPGEHTLKVSLPGFQNQTIPLTITSGYSLKLTIKLAQSS